jgi:ferritin-like metal-binding protein YciE
MAQDNKPITNLHNLLDYDARKFAGAEVQLREIMPVWSDKASSLKLKVVLNKYGEYIKEHIEKADRFFEEEKISSFSPANRIMQGFIEEADDKLNQCADPEVKDACLLACIQGINHFKISAYGTAAAFANALGMEKFASVFHEAEVNEKQIDDRLSQLAEHEINLKARSPIVLP